jgi:ABC-type molybdenum transport system ATPase subunit/photorepair protein PhrA
MTIAMTGAMTLILTRFVGALSACAIAAVVVAAVCFSSSFAQAAMSDADQAALKQYTTTCRAEVKEQAKYQEMSWYAQHKAVKDCIKRFQAQH